MKKKDNEDIRFSKPLTYIVLLNYKRPKVTGERLRLETSEKGLTPSPRLALPHAASLVLLSTGATLQVISLPLQRRIRKLLSFYCPPRPSIDSGGER